MYQNSRSTRPWNHTRRPFTPGRFNRPNPNRGRSKLEGNINLFIKKAADVLPSESFVPQNSFAGFQISEALKQSIRNRGYTQPTPIQDKAIVPILEGRDLIGLANTGTGKTAAFLIPLIDKILKNRNQKVLIMAPTRELATQINDELRSFSREMRIYSALIIGGASMNRQIQDLRRNPNFVIATPGRLKDLLSRKILILNNFSTFVLDEVDLMVDIGFLQDVKYFISLLPQNRQSLFFSATIGPKVHEVLQSFVRNPITVSVKVQDTAENIDQDVIRIVNQEKKVEQLHDLLIKESFEKVLVFGRTKHGIEKLNKQLTLRGFKVGAIHGNKTQGHRQRTLDSFKRSEIRILLATDVAARGLDIPNVSHVINYDLPETYDDYVHRIGRTGRINKKGTALTFVG
ncbi:MAG: DEAD/DEAH box helicase [bacterium]|nr:DEAD/DEAH box helicase [bacterium]